MLLTRMATLPMTLAKHSQMMKKTNEILKKNNVHLDFFDKQGKFGGIENMVSQLEKLQKIKSDQERAEVLKNLFGQEGGRPAELISRKGLSGYQTALKAMDDQASLQQRTDALTQSFSNTVKALGGSIETAVGMAFEPLGNALIPIMKGMNSIVSHSIMPWIERNQKLVGTITAVVSGLVGLRVAMLAIRIGGLLLNGGIIGITKRLVGMGAAAAAATVSAESAAAASGGMSAALTGAFGAVAAIGWPIVLIAGAIAAAGLLVWKYWEPIKAWFIGLGQGIAEVVGPAFRELGDAFEPLAPAFHAIGDAIGFAWHWFTALLTPMHATNGQLQAATENGQTFGQVLGQVIAVAIRAATYIVKAFSVVGTAIGECIGWVAVNLPDAWETLKTKVGAVVDWIMQKLKPLRDGMAWIGKEADQLGVTAGTKKVGNAIGSAWDWMTNGDKKPATAAGAVSGSNAAAATVAGVAPATPSMPPLATARAAQAPATVIHQQNTFQITQQAGESSDAFARRVADLQKQQNGVAQRGSLIDGAGS